MTLTTTAATTCDGAQDRRHPVGTYHRRPINTPAGATPHFRISTFEWGFFDDLLAALQSPEGQGAAADVANVASGGVTLLFFDEEDL